MTRLTRDRILELVGRIDDGRIARVLEAGASEKDLTEAMVWLSEDDYLAKSLHRMPSGVVAKVYEILKTMQPEVEDDREV